MVTKSVVNLMLVLRLIALATSAAAMALLVTNTVTENGFQFKYQDFTSYSFMVAIAAFACAYCLMQLPFAIYYAVQQKRMIRNGFLREFDFYGDKVTSLLLAIGIGVGFALSVEAKKFIDDTFSSGDYVSVANKFFIRAIIASIFLFMAFLSMAIVSFTSSINLSKNN